MTEETTDQNTNISISIIIPTHNRSALLCRTIESFIQQDYPNDKYEIIIIDNASTDDTKQVLTKYFNNANPEIRYIRNKLESQYSQNQGAAEAKKEILYFADDDVIADKNLLTELCIPFALNKRTAVAIGRVAPKWETQSKWIKWYYSKFLNSLNAPEDLVISKNINFIGNCFQAVKKDVYVSANNLAVIPVDEKISLNEKIQMLGYLFSYNGKAIAYQAMPHQRMSKANASELSTLFIVFILLKFTFIFVPLVYLVNIFNLLRYNNLYVSRFFVTDAFCRENSIKYFFKFLRNKKISKLNSLTNTDINQEDIKKDLENFNHSTEISASTQLPTISVIIPTHNRSKYILKTLESFLDQNYPKDRYEIIVVDNNSSDDTADVVNGFIANKNNIKYILEPRIGNHYARNSAASTAKNDILYFCDDDIVADHLLLREIIRPFIINKMVGTATGRVLPRWEIPPPKWIQQYCNNRFLSLLDPPEEFLISNNINFLFSCHQAVRKNTFIEAGGFNPELFGNGYLGDGETGLNIKISKLGYKFAFNGASLAYHVMPPKRYTQSYLNKRLRNAGYAQAYTDFRKSQKHPLFKLPFMMLKATFVYMPSVYISIFINFLDYKDLNILRFFTAQSYFYKNYLQYSFWLLFDSDWRAFASKSNWMQNDIGFEEEIQKYSKY